MCDKIVANTKAFVNLNNECKIRVNKKQCYFVWLLHNTNNIAAKRNVSRLIPT